MYARIRGTLAYYSRPGNLLHGHIITNTLRGSHTPEIEHLRTRIKSIIENSEVPIPIRHIGYVLIGERDVLRNLSPRGRGQELTHAAAHLKVNRLVNELRDEDDESPLWDKISDETRGFEGAVGFSSLDEYLDPKHIRYRRDPWQDQPRVLWLLVEKAAIIGVFRKTLAEYRMQYLVLKGNFTTTLSNQAAKKIIALGKPVRVLYVGDFDPTGLNISGDLRPVSVRSIASKVKRRLKALAADESLFTVERVALLQRHMERRDLRKFWVDVKDLEKAQESGKEYGDPNAERYKEQFPQYRKNGRPACLEVDAPDPRELIREVETAIRRHLDPVAWQRSLRREEREIAQVRQLFRSARRRRSS